MSEKAMTEVHTDEIGEVKEYHVQELVDDALSAGRFNEYMRGQYVYEFKQGNRVIRGLSADAIAHIALEQGITIEDVDVRETDKGVLVTATALKMESGLRAIGISYEPFMSNTGIFDKFAWQKALTKASRNARKQLIPATVRVQAIDIFLNLDPDDRQSLPAPKPVDLSPAVNGETASKDEGKDMRQAFAVYSEHSADLLSSLRLSEEDFWSGVRRHYEVESRNDMTDAEWRNLTASIKIVGSDGPYAKWIRDLQDPEGDSLF